MQYTQLACNLLSNTVPIFSRFSEAYSPGFRVAGIQGDTWHWLMRRCNRGENHFVGLISVLLEGTASILESPQDEIGSDRDSFMRGYEISGIKQEHWTSDGGFTKAFPVHSCRG